ncbi:ParB/RepB/Spo0J family partition protein [Micromonospora antibiotica]|uniref:ParB/RepB/Spo0J family partition protein n=1 Tax=Micromonospora antibiotica TaxID=2807623 RepID=UPI0027DE7EAF|nr:ParB N-terminal domain-containing protein [Micromonospora antibiotica]
MLTEATPAPQTTPPDHGPAEADVRLTDQPAATTVDEAGESAPNLPGRYRLVKVTDLRPNPDNVRDDAQALPGIVENLREDGVRGLVSALTVTPIGADSEGPYLIVDGEQRYWSAIEANQEYVPAIIRDDLAENREQLISMLRQVHRKDPTATQQARGIQQLALDGMDDNDIARRTGYDREQVRAGRQLATLDKNTTDRTHALGLDLTQVAALAQFADRPDWIEHLLEQAEEGPFAFARAVERTRRTRAALDAQTSRHAALTEAGIATLATRPAYADSTVKEVTDLRDADGQRIDAETHLECPGHAVFLSIEHDELTETAYCTSWHANGHTLPAYLTPSTRSGPMSEQEKAERRRVIENNKAMDIANTVRREWLTTFLTAKTPPKGTAKLLAEALADSGYILSTWINGGRRMLDELLYPGKAKRAGMKRVPARGNDGRYAVISLAAIAAANESGISRSSWRVADPGVANWLRWCVTNGFQLSEVEQLILDTADGRAKQHADVTAAVSQSAPHPGTSKTDTVERSAAGDDSPGVDADGFVGSAPVV